MVVFGSIKLKYKHHFGKCVGIPIKRKIFEKTTGKSCGEKQKKMAGDRGGPSGQSVPGLIPVAFYQKTAGPDRPFLSNSMFQGVMDQTFRALHTYLLHDPQTICAYRIYAEVQFPCNILNGLTVSKHAHHLKFGIR